MNAIRCSDCHAVLVHSDSESPRRPCANCGSTRRTFSENITAGVSASGHLSGVGLRQGRAVGFLEGAKKELTRYADIAPDGSIVLALAGHTPRNEQDADCVCSLFARGLSARGHQIALVGPGDRDDDFIAIEVRRHTITIQVVRAMTRQEFWTDLFRFRRIGPVRLTASEAVERLREAISHKSRIPHRQRASMFLVLDAYRLPALALSPVVDAFRLQHAEWAINLQFRGIFVVGPGIEFVERLDQLPQRTQ
jgi:hypothetical protein